jgi:twinkle protein
MVTWSELGIETHGKTTGEIKTTCPRCSPYRKKKTYPCLNANLDKGLWNCWHCAWSGSLKGGEEHQSNPAATPLLYRKPVYRETSLPSRVIEWFAGRGIPVNVLARRRISYGPVYMPQLEQEVPTIQFPYFRQGEVVNCKYRDGHKHFRMVGGAERLFYGLDDVQGDTVIICEGEMDALALEVAGYTSVLSVPDGAPAIESKEYEKKFEFLRSAESLLAPLKRIILAVDTDAPGVKLAQELARRVGPERCYTVAWSSGCKDANEVLVSHGAAVLKECIEQAAPWPVSGIVTVEDLSSLIDHIYEYGIPPGLSTGWPTVDRHYTVRPGELTLVTGVPGHGKTQWLSGLAVNMASVHDWQFAICSLESLPLQRYAALLIETSLGIPFEGSPKMTRAELDHGKRWLGKHVSFLLPRTTAPTLDCLLELAEVQVYRQGIKGLILDPWNRMEHQRPTWQTETEYVGSVLNKLELFGQHHGVHVWLVAHPTKLRKIEKGEMEGQYPVPTPYDVSGSAHFRNMPDNCIAVWRNLAADDQSVEVHIQKIRFREIGKVGMVRMRFDPRVGRYHDIGDMTERRHWNGENDYVA